MLRLDNARLELIGPAMRAPIERGEVAGLVALVAHGGDIHVEVHGLRDLKSGEQMRRDTIFRIASMTKAVTAAAAMILVEETILRLDDPVDPWLPELANRKVSRQIDGAVDDTVPARRPITLRDLLTFTCGMGLVFAPPGTYPIQKAIEEAGFMPGPNALQVTQDEYMKRLGALPLIDQPGEQWRYHTGSDVLGVLIARAAGTPFDVFLQERIFVPLGMTDTGVYVPAAKQDRLATGYGYDDAGKLVIVDEARGRFAKPPLFPSGGAGLVSTADDYLAFARMLLRGGEGVLSRAAVELMMTDALTTAQKAASRFTPGFFDNQSWAFGGSVITRRTGLATSPGQYGWVGGHGTLFGVDRSEDMITVFLSQRAMRHPWDISIGQDFQTLAYRALAD
jgi:CubicO group peptidase (beta-lactamase class C family)